MIKNLWTAFKKDRASQEQKHQETLKRSAMRLDEKLTKRERDFLPQLLAKNEIPLAYCSGFTDGHNWLIALTNRRIIFLHCSFLGNTNQVSLDLTKVIALVGETGFFQGSITITHSSSTPGIKKFSTAKPNVNHFLKVATEAIQQVDSIDPVYPELGDPLGRFAHCLVLQHPMPPLLERAGQ